MPQVDKLRARVRVPQANKKLGPRCCGWLRSAVCDSEGVLLRMPGLSEHPRDKAHLPHDPRATRTNSCTASCCADPGCVPADLARPPGGARLLQDAQQPPPVLRVLQLSHGPAPVPSALPWLSSLSPR